MEIRLTYYKHADAEALTAKQLLRKKAKISG
jgi:hypothetical protein